ncbi:MBL fold metallo-hydrolase [soil metagenome]
MKSIGFFGGAGDVTGSSYLLTSEKGSKLLVDFGMFQGGKDMMALNYQDVHFKASDIQGIVLTHAHLDHCGRLPLLVYGGYFGKIYMTAPTQALVEVILTDSAKIAKENVEYGPLYGSEEVEKTLEMIEIVDYDTEFSIGDLNITFRDAGHILGSASVEVEDKTSKKRAVFSGDIGNFPEDIVRKTRFIDEADFVVMESTYGDSMHPKEDPTQIIKEEINTIERSGGVLLIPAFSLERTQELLHRIHHLKKEGQIRLDTPIFMDSPMAIRATLIFKEFKEFYNEELRSHTDDPFSFDGLVITEEARNSREIIRAMAPKVIIAGSGMLSGGRILHHAANYLPIETTRVLFVGYQSEETLGRKILEGARTAVINDQQIKVRAHIREIKSLSSHADQPKLLEWLGHIKYVKKVFLIHGETKQRNTLAEKIKSELKLTNITMPQHEQEVLL